MTVYFTDRDLGKVFPARLAAAGIAVERHADRFGPEGSDEEWIRYCGLQGRIAISHNRDIRYVRSEREAVESFGVGLIIVIGKAPTPDLADNFVRSIAKIESFVGEHARPFIAKLYRPSPRELQAAPTMPGRIELWYPGP